VRGGPDPRAGDGEVVEFLGVDGGAPPGPPGLGEVVDGEGGRVAGVIPSLERDDQQRPAEDRMVLPTNNLHRRQLTCLGGIRRTAFIGVPRRGAEASAIAAAGTGVSDSRWCFSAGSQPLVPARGA